MLKEFKQFILRGNAIDLVVGVMVGTALGAVVTSIVKDIMTPLIAPHCRKPGFLKTCFLQSTAAIYCTVTSLMPSLNFCNRYGCLLLHRPTDQPFNGYVQETKRTALKRCPFLPGMFK